MSRNLVHDGDESGLVDNGLPESTRDFVQKLCHGLFRPEERQERQADICLLLQRLQGLRSRLEISWKAFNIVKDKYFMRWKSTELVQNMLRSVDGHWGSLDGYSDDLVGFTKFVDNALFKHIYGGSGCPESTYKPLRDFLKKAAGHATVERRTDRVYPAVFFALMLRDVNGNLAKQLECAENDLMKECARLAEEKRKAEEKQKEMLKKRPNVLTRLGEETLLISKAQADAVSDSSFALSSLGKTQLRIKNEAGEWHRRNCNATRGAASSAPVPSQIAERETSEATGDCASSAVPPGSLAEHFEAHVRAPLLALHRHATEGRGLARVWGRHGQTDGTEFVTHVIAPSFLPRFVFLEAREGDSLIH